MSVKISHPGPHGWKGTAVAWQYPGPVQADWWYDYRHRETQLADPTFVPMVWSMAETDLESLAKKYPGRHWLLLNEPDNPLQANMTCDIAAARYAEYYHAIRRGDPTAHIGGPNILFILSDGQTTGHGFTDYSGAFIREVQRLGAGFDFWCFHLWFARYHDGILYRWGDARVDFQAAENHIAHVRRMLGDVPIWITEAGGELGPGTDHQAYLQDMETLIIWLRTEGFALGIERVAWFSRYWDEGGYWYSSLYRSDGSLSPVGTAWHLQ